MNRSSLVLIALACTYTLPAAAQLTTASTAPVSASSSFHLEEATIDDIQQAILAGVLTTERLVELYLARIKAYNGTCVKQPQGILRPITTIPNAGQINALQTLNLRPAAREQWGFDPRKARSMTDAADADPGMPDALEIARTLDAQFAATGRLVGPLHGVVMAIKDQGSSIRGPAYSANSVGIAPTQELVSRDGMIQQGINTRVGPICRTVEDAAKVLDVIAGYDPKDELTAFTVGRLPSQPYASFAAPGRLDGLRIGVVREYMDKRAFTKEDEAAIDIVLATAAEMGKLGATMVDPGVGGALFDDCVRRYHPMAHDKQFARAHPQLFAEGKPAADHIASLIELAADPSRLPGTIGFRMLEGAPTPGQGRYALDRYLLERGDANIRTTADLLTKANYYTDPNFPDHKRRHERSLEDQELDMAARMQDRFAIQTMVLQCMAEMDLDAVVYPTSNHPPAKLGAPRGGDVNGRPGDGVWRFLGRNGFPVITVPAGFTTEVYDRVRVAPAAQASSTAAPAGVAPPAVQTTGAIAPAAAASASTAEGEDPPTELVGPVRAVLPIGVDIVARPFDEPTLLKIAAAYEAATRHRRPPKDFGPLDGEP